MAEVKKFGGSAKCYACEKSLYPADPQTNIDGKKLHADCFKCEHCKMKLSLANYSIVNDKLYCKPHFIQLFKRGGGKYDLENVETLGHSKDAAAAPAPEEKPAA